MLTTDAKLLHKLCSHAHWCSETSKIFESLVVKDWLKNLEHGFSKVNCNIIDLQIRNYLSSVLLLRLVPAEIKTVSVQDC